MKKTFPSNSESKSSLTFLCFDGTKNNTNTSTNTRYKKQLYLVQKLVSEAEYKKLVIQDVEEEMLPLNITDSP